MGPVGKGGMRDLTVREVDEGGEVRGSTWVVGSGTWSHVNMNDGKVIEKMFGCNTPARGQLPVSLLCSTDWVIFGKRDICRGCCGQRGSGFEVLNGRLAMVDWRRRCF